MDAGRPIEQVKAAAAQKDKGTGAAKDKLCWSLALSQSQMRCRGAAAMSECTRGLKHVLLLALRWTTKAVVALPLERVPDHVLGVHLCRGKHHVLVVELRAVASSVSVVCDALLREHRVVW
jgi:hypothetical protein